MGRKRLEPTVVISERVKARFQHEIRFEIKKLIKKMTAQKQITEFLDSRDINKFDYKLIEFSNDKAILNGIEIFRMYSPEYDVIELSSMGHQYIAVLTPMEMKGLFNNFFHIVNCQGDNDFR